MNKSTDAQTILVTGSSRGIGRAIALRLARDGYDIVVHCRSDLAKAKQTAADIDVLGRCARVLQFDVADRAQCAAALDQDIEEYGAYYGVVCNAGIALDNAFPAMTGQEWDTVVHTNLDAFYNVLHPVVMPMVHRRKPGRIVTLASVAALVGNRGQTNYSASKAGVIGATKSLAIELAKRNITVNCVAPGLIDTDMVNEEVLKHAFDMIPMRRMGSADEVAGVVSFLMGQDASYVTRQVISVNGGMFG